MTTSPPNGLLRVLQLQPQRAIGFLATVVALLLVLLVTYDLRRDYEEQFAAATAKTHSVTLLLEEHAIQSMRRVELALSLAAQEIETTAGYTGQVTPATGTSLRSYLPQDGLIASFAVIDANGKTVASTLTEKTSELPMAADRDFFLAHQDPSFSGVFIGAAVKSRISGNWIIPVSIKLQGGFHGYLMGAVDPEYFQRLYQTIDTGEMGFVTLFTNQGWAVARWPFHSEVAERNWLNSPLFKEHITGALEADDGRFVTEDGTESVFSYRMLREYPLTIVLGVSVEETLSPWRERIVYESGGLLLVLLVLGGSTALVLAQLRKRLEAESALKLSEISVLKSSLPTLWIGPDARVLRVNKAACDLHGYSEAQMLTMTILDLNPDMSIAKWPAHWARLRTARNLHFETVHRTGQGEDVPVDVELNFIEFEGQEYNFAFMRDLTLRKQADAEVQRSAAMLRGAIDAVDEAFVLFDANDRLVYCNAKYSAMYPLVRDMIVPGISFEEMIRAGAARGLYRDSIGREEEWIAERLRAHREGDETRVQKRDDGRVLRVIDRKTPDGNIVGIRVDITEMVQATEEAQEASRYKSQFLANMSHEIRTPMNAILGLLTLLQKTGLTSVQRDYANKTHGAAQSLLGLLNDILDFSKVEAGKLELDPQPFRLDRMLRDIGVILSATIAGKSIEVLFDIGATVPSVVVADSMRLQQVLVNLCGNAIKFTSEGQVILRVRNVPDPDPVSDPVSASRPTSVECSWIEFSIQDSGIGIAAEQQDHIFSGFSQAEASTTRRYGGTGLGLAICKRLVELMGGTLQLRSAPGEGSTFSFQLPFARPELTAESAPPSPQLSIAPKRTLIVDDNPSAREILAAMTESWSWSTEVVESGAQALESIRLRLQPGQAPFDVIYLDWQMPDMDGWETLRGIRALCQSPVKQPHVVMLTANARDTLNVRTEEEQVTLDGFVFKPATPSALQEAALSGGPDARVLPLRTSSNRPLAGMRILVVEDNLINQQVAEELLNAEGALVSLAANGQLGVDAVAASDPGFDVVLMDIQMPVLDGYGATRKIRKELQLTALPIVAMTANAMVSDRQACLAAGMNEHVGKPFDMRHLIQVLLTITGKTAQSSLPVESAVRPEEQLPGAVPADFSSDYLDVNAALSRLSGMRSLYVTISKEFIKSLDTVESEFRGAAARGDVAGLVTQMHSLKGTSATLGAQKLSEYVSRLEKMFRTPTANLVPLHTLPELLSLVQATRDASVLAAQAMADNAVAPAHEVHHVDGPVHRAAAIAFLTELSQLLAQSNLTALELFAESHGALDALAESALQAIQEALQNLDLDVAKELCDAQIEVLKGLTT